MGMLSNIKISTRLGIGFALVLALTATMTGVGIWYLKNIGNDAHEMSASATRLQLAQSWLRGTSVNAARTLAVSKLSKDEDKQYFQSEMAAESKAISKVQSELEKQIATEKGKQLLSTVAEKRTEYISIRNNILSMQKENADESAVRNAIETKLKPSLKDYVASIDDVVAYQLKTFEELDQDVKEIEASALKFMIFLGLSALTLGALMAWLITRSILTPVNQAVAVARTVASGDLTSKIDVTSTDETGQLLQALKEMNESLQQLVGQVHNGADTIASASKQIASGNMDLSSRTEGQASSLEETASSIEELTSTVKQNADNARQANQLAITASDVAVEGGEVVAKVVGTMDSINNSSKKIVDIISVIDGIAFQTNILALNAAVEAARAGEQGRGFAVVAAEVRNLAQRSAAAAKEIKSLIGDSVDKVDEGSKLVGQAGATMENVVSSIKRVADIVAEIAAASQEQSAGIEQVNQSIVQMDQVTQQNAALVEEAAAAAQSLQDQASALTELVGTFKIKGSNTSLHNSPSIIPVRAEPVLRSRAATNQARKDLKLTENPKKPSLQDATTATNKSVSKSSADTGDWEEF